MIDPRELRLGNYVLTESSYGDSMVIQINGITSTSINGVTSIMDLSVSGMTAYDIKPIPLTEEILLKCGFNPIKSAYPGHWYENFYFELANLVGNELWVVRIFKHHMPGSYKYLHQIQNLWRDVTGEELEVKL